MQIRHLVLLPAVFVIACSISTAPPESKKARVELPKKPEEKAPEEKKLSSAALSLEAYKRELALRIYQINASKVYPERPQALLRSVIVLKYLLNAEGKLLRSEILRSNRDQVTEATALGSVRNAAPFARPATHLLRNGKLEIIETWLFNNDGRFQLRTIALPQMDE